MQAVELVEVKEEHRQVLYNLLEKYQYEFSQWEKNDVNENGDYGYQYLYCYFEEEQRHSYLIKVDGKLAGFVMVSDYPEAPRTKVDFVMSEFFVMYKYRKNGVGSIAAKRVFDMHHGKWQLKRHPHNIPSVKFWDKVVAEYTNNNFKLVEAYPDKEVDYEDGTPADVFFFEN